MLKPVIQDEHLGAELAASEHARLRASARHYHRPLETSGEHEILVADDGRIQ